MGKIEKRSSKKVKDSQDPDLEYQKLHQKTELYIKDPQSLEQLKKSYIFAKERHEGQYRKSGEPYIIHPVNVAMILADLNVDISSLIAAILHDVVEDTETNLSEIEDHFSKVIADLVDGLTKIGKIKFRSNQERMAENFRKMILAMAKDLRVILVKLADRLHNMRTLSSLPEEKRRRIAHETLDIYAPLASRLGIYGIKSELEDLCLKETKNEVYKEISRKISAKKKQRESYIEEVIQILETELKKYGFKNIKVFGRPKHFFSIYKKMMDRRLAFEDIHDLFAFRIIVDSVKDCYEALGVIHAMWKPMPGRFKDYIAMPKANLYQSLHTTVIRPNGSPAEIQIRTHDMHSICEFGIAAHWSYKEQSVPSADLKTFSWLRQMMETHHDVKDPNEFLDAVKVDLFEEEIFVFTPKGDVIQLASGSTPLDFAFAVHSDVGLSTVGAKVNGRITPLRSTIHSGDIVEILTSSSQKPSKDWLNFVTTSKARNKIRSFLRSEKRDISKKIGRDLLSHELSMCGNDLEKIINQGKSELLVKAGKESGLDELLIAIGYGKINARDIVEKVFPSKENLPTNKDKDKDSPQNPPKESTKTNQRPGGILVSGLNNILVTYGRCCNPLPGDHIVGFITRGRGVSIHRSNCDRALDLDPARRIEVSWAAESQLSRSHTAFLNIVTQDRQGILADITLAISSCGANIKRAKVKVSDDQKGVLDFEIGLNSLDHLNKIMSKIESIEDVLMVKRKEKDRATRNKKKSSKLTED